MSKSTGTLRGSGKSGYPDSITAKQFSILRRAITVSRCRGITTVAKLRSVLEVEYKEDAADITAALEWWGNSMSNKRYA